MDNKIIYIVVAEGNYEVDYAFHLVTAFYNEKQANKFKQEMTIKEPDSAFDYEVYEVELY